MKIQHVRLVNGDELIGDVIIDDHDAIVISHPLLVDEVSNELGDAMVLNHYIPLSENTACKIKKIHVVTMTDLHPIMQEHYELSLQTTGRLTERILGEIDRVNQAMKALLMEDSIDPTRLSKGTDTVH